MLVGVGGLFVPDPASTVLVPFLLVVLRGRHALSVGDDAELASATLVCGGVGLVVALLLVVSAALAGNTQSEVSTIGLGVTLPVGLLSVSRLDMGVA